MHLKILGENLSQKWPLEIIQSKSHPFRLLSTLCAAIKGTCLNFLKQFLSVQQLHHNYLINVAIESHGDDKNSEEKADKTTSELLTLNRPALTLKWNHSYESQMLPTAMCGLASDLLVKYSKKLCFQN